MMTKNMYEANLICRFDSKINIENRFNEIIEKVDTRKYFDSNKYSLRNVKFAVLTICYTIIIILVIIPLTLGVNSYFIEESEADNSHLLGDINPGKNKDLATKYFDVFYAFGSASPASLYSLDILLNSNMLSDESKNILRQSESSSNSFYNVYLGMKDGVDYVVLSQLNDPYSILVFESIFDYSFNDCISEFQKMCCHEITQDYLISSKFDNLLKKETKGILVNFKLINRQYFAYYTLEMNGILYVLNK